MFSELWSVFGFGLGGWCADLDVIADAAACVTAAALAVAQASAGLTVAETAGVIGHQITRFVTDPDCAGAHLPDSEPDGRPILANGLALCTLHHAAHDAQVLGITPDFKVRIAPALMNEVDGPVLKHGLQALDGGALVLPTDRTEWPDPARLARRYSALAWG